MISTGFGLEPNTFHITHSDGPALFLSLPVFELDGLPAGTYGALVDGPGEILSNGALQWSWSLPFTDRPGLWLDMV